MHASIHTYIYAKAEEEAEKQEELARAGEQLFRITSLYSATMPSAVENLAKSYVQNPSIRRSTETKPNQ